MGIIFHEESKEFHLFNQDISYLIQILDNGQLGNLYCGKRLHDKEDFSYLLQGGSRSFAVFNKENEHFLSQQYTKLEYPSFGTGDFRYPAFEIEQEDGSRITNFTYEDYRIIKGKKKLSGLPATYVEDEEEAETLEITLRDSQLQAVIVLSYTIFRDFPVLARNTRFQNEGAQKITLQRALSAAVDMPDCDYEMIHLSGAWGRERHIKTRRLEQGIQGIYSMRGASSAEHNPFIVLKRPHATEDEGEVFGFSLVYSGNHIEQVEVDTNNMTRILIGIHPDTFEWTMDKGEEFQTPEAVMVYSDKGINHMSQTFHSLYRTRLARGYWRDKPRPILINNWEATEMEFTEEQVLSIAKAGKELGMELFVLDDGWFGGREDDTRGLGDWYVTNFEKLPDGITGLSKKISEMGMLFGLWFEPEMVNRKTNLYQKHPDWVICAPGRTASPSRNQYVLDFSNQAVVDYIYGLMEKVLSEGEISYVKWDMNRYITECYSNVCPSLEQGKVYHKYILGVYRLYERLTTRFPEILFESCASGGGRFDAGILYYAPQTWTSDDSDAMERIKIQYGTSLVYPVSSMGAHVSEVPNQQVGRITPLQTRGNVAMFGAFGYEMDLNLLSEEEKEIVKQQVCFVKQHRELIQQGTFYRIHNPFEEQIGAWIVVSKDRRKALAGYYRFMGLPNAPWDRFRLKGLDCGKKYYIGGDRSRYYYGDELMQAGIPLAHNGYCESNLDFTSDLFYIEEAE